MSAASLSALWCDFRTNIQEVSGYCSSATRDVAYFDLAGASTLDAMNRAKLSRDYRIMLQIHLYHREIIGH